jgi:hypothetical protein
MALVATFIWIGLVWAVGTALDLPWWAAVAIGALAPPVLYAAFRARTSGPSSPAVAASRQPAVLNGITITVETTNAELKSAAKALGRAMAESTAKGSRRRAMNMLENVPTNDADLEAMTLFGGLPFEPLASVTVPYTPPLPDSMHSKLTQFQLTCFQAFHARLSARLEPDPPDPELAKKAQQVADDMTKRDRSRTLRKLEGLTEDDWIDLGSVRRTYLRALADRLRDLSADTVA